MRAMIFGDTASGKSTFAEQLGDVTGIPVIHLDQIMDETGRDNRPVIGEFIRKEADKDEWIIEGNAFTKDPNYRIEQADIIFAFDFNPVRTLAAHIARHRRINRGTEQRVGSSSAELNLRYFVPYIFNKFPSRKRAALDHAKNLDKEIVIFKRKKEASEYIAGLRLAE